LALLQAFACTRGLRERERESFIRNYP